MLLTINNLNVCVENNMVIYDLSLNINSGEIHAIMGPNGSGKSTLSLTIVGHKTFKVTSGEIFFKEKNLLNLNTEERVGEGIFMAFQNPIEIPGVSNQLFLRTAINSIRKYKKLTLFNQFDFNDFVKEKMKILNISDGLLNRSVNVGFSGGEKKKNDILQMLILEPELCILDEIDSGLDIDSLKTISNVINDFHSKKRSFVIITHYQRILNHIKPDYVHILYKGSIIKSGDFSLSKYIEEKGYGWIKT